MIIAIDGPAGSGKSTVAKLVAGKLGYHYLDTGAMYRAVAFRALSTGVDLSDEAGIATIAARDAIAFAHAPGDPLPSLVSIAGRDVTAAIRTPETDAAVSAVASMPSVRQAMVAQQREIARDSDTVVEGRDIGTVVFPDAALKVYLTASPEERARRRAIQQSQAGMVVNEERVHEALLRRDRADATRDHSPLAAADDAVLLDTTGLTLDEVVDRVVDLAKARTA